MLEKKLGILFLTICLILITISNALGAQITVSPTSETDAQTAINSAIESVASSATSSNQGFVLLTAGTYNISGPIVLKSNVVLRGADDSTIIRGNGSSVCNSDEEPAYIFGSGVSHVEISNLQFKSTASQPRDGGHGAYRNCIQLSSSNNSTVHDILFTRYLYNDGVTVIEGNNITVYNCRIYSAAHDGVAFLSDSSNCRMCNCDVQVQTNTGVRVDYGINCEVDHNTFTSGTAGSGWCCVELENTLTNVNVHHNIMHDFRGSDGSAGIGRVRTRGSFNVYENVMWNVSPYMQIGSEDNNTLGPDDQNVSNWVEKGYGYDSINITPKSDPINTVVAGFNCSVTSGSTPFRVDFTDISTGAPTSWFWDFGDGSTSTHQNPTHTYYTAGTYTVNLTVSNGYKTDSKNAIITVQEGGSSGGGGSGGGGGGSPEPQSNVEAKEISQAFITSGKSVKFEFPRNATPIVCVSFDSKKTAGKTSTIIEMLKGKSTLVSELPSAEIYKSLNIWVGNGGFGDSNNIENATVYFKVEKAWIQDKKIDKSSITLNRYSDKKWSQLPASLSGEDNKYLYFISKTPGFSPFAITGKTTATGTAIQPAAGNKTQNNTGNTVANAEQTPEQKENTNNSEKGDTKTPGFEIFSGIVCLLGVFLYKRRKIE